MKSYIAAVACGVGDVARAAAVRRARPPSDRCGRRQPVRSSVWRPVERRSIATPRRGSHVATRAHDIGNSPRNSRRVMVMQGTRSHAARTEQPVRVWYMCMCMRRENVSVSAMSRASVTTPHAFGFVLTRPSHARPTVQSVRWSDVTAVGVARRQSGSVARRRGPRRMPPHWGVTGV